MDMTDADDAQVSDWTYATKFYWKKIVFDGKSVTVDASTITNLKTAIQNANPTRIAFDDDLDFGITSTTDSNSTWLYNVKQCAKLVSNVWYLMEDSDYTDANEINRCGQFVYITLKTLRYSEDIVGTFTTVQIPIKDIVEAKNIDALEENELGTYRYTTKALTNYTGLTCYQGTYLKNRTIITTEGLV